MCGFTGIVQQNEDQFAAEQLEKALNIIKHRGPDSTNYYYDNHVAFGHNRLSIFDTSEKGNQPMVDDNYVIIFNGAIYNFPELKTELQEYQFKSNSDTEVILAAYKKWGEDCVTRFNGQWSFLLYDKQNKEVFCSRDRYGIKPFYYAEINGTFYFASEIKSLLLFDKIEAEENIQKATTFLAYGFQNQDDETFYKNIKCLAPATNMKLDIKSGLTTKHKYYTLSATQSECTKEKASKRLNELFLDSISKRYRADVPVGISLSAGLDSASIACGLHHLHPDTRLPTVSAVYQEETFSEEVGIDKLATFISSNTFKAQVKQQNVIDALSKIIWHHDQPIASMSICSQYFVFQKAAENNIKVMLGGQGADEILMGYDSFLKTYLRESKNPFKTLLALLNLTIKVPSLFFKARKSTPTHDWLRQDFPQSNQRYRTTKKQSIAYINSFILPALLHYEDRNAMAHGIESRLPFLDHRIVDFVLSLPTKFLISKGVRKHLLRESLKSLLPTWIYKDNNKKPFLSPQTLWMKKDATYYLKEINDRKELIKDLVDASKISSLDNVALFRILSYAIWKEQHFS